MISRRRGGGPITDFWEGETEEGLTNIGRRAPSWAAMVGSTVGPARAGSIGISCAPFRWGVSRSAE